MTDCLHCLMAVTCVLARLFTYVVTWAGLQQGDGRLSAAEERAMKRYRSRLQLWSRPEQQAAALAWVQGVARARESIASGRTSTPCPEP